MIAILLLAYSHWIAGLADTHAAPRNTAGFRICTITLNSSDERSAFHRELSRENGFEFTELVPANATGDAWFDSACQQLQAQRASCDVLLISGHFAGELFFGTGRRTGPQLFMETLQRHSCRRDCTEILNDPQKVFLFGCNTLAGNEPDHRTLKEYVQALRHSGIGALDAQRIADARYGPFSQSFRHQMKQIFNGESQLIGFDSVAPKGKTTAQKLKKFFMGVRNQYGSFRNALLEDAARSTIGKLGATSNDLGKIFVGSLRAQGCSATALPKEPLLEAHRRIRENLCVLNDPDTWYSTRMLRMAKLMRSSDALAYLPTMQNFFRQVPPRHFRGGRPGSMGYKDERENAAYLELRAAGAPPGFKQALQSSTAGYSRLQLAVLAYELGWISEAAFDTSALHSIRAMWKQNSDLDSDTTDYLCQTAWVYPRFVRELLDSNDSKHIRRSAHYKRLKRCLSQ